MVDEEENEVILSCSKKKPLDLECNAVVFFKLNVPNLRKALEPKLTGVAYWAKFCERQMSSCKTPSISIERLGSNNGSTVNHRGCHSQKLEQELSRGCGYIY